MFYRFKVRLNGTDENPWLKLGFTRNPFPQIGKAEFNVGEQIINGLDADPIKDIDDLRQRLKGCSDEFIELCIKNFKPGERVEFYCSFEYGG